jgi:pyruvate/2-oxoglutarate dehydrogenase complex dihydrolipoamide acyltransferase (E2) component
LLAFLVGSWDDGSIIYHKDVNLSIAVTTDEHLYVPVIQQADNYSIAGLACNIAACGWLIIPIDWTEPSVPVLLRVKVPPCISNLSIAVTTDEHLYVPVIQQADNYSIAGLAKEINRAFIN